MFIKPVTIAALLFLSAGGAAFPSAAKDKSHLDGPHFNSKVARDDPKPDIFGIQRFANGSIHCQDPASVPEFPVIDLAIVEQLIAQHSGSNTSDIDFSPALRNSTDNGVLPIYANDDGDDELDKAKELAEAGISFVGGTAGATAAALPSTALGTAISSGLGLAGAVLGAVGGFISLIINIAKELKKKDHTFRGKFIKKSLEVLQDKYEDHNVFIYHQFQDDFKWYLDDESTMITTQAALKRKDVADTTEYFNIVVFRGGGWLQNSGDHGWQNWGYAGSYEETEEDWGRHVDFF